MDFRTIFGVLLLGGVFCQGSLGQEKDPNAQSNPPAESGQHGTPAPALTGGLLSPDAPPAEAPPYQNRFSTGPTVPAIIGGYGSSLAFSTEMARSNYIRGGAAVQAAYDDNPFLSPGSSTGNLTLSVFPQIALDQSRRRIHWTLNYAGGYTYNDKLEPKNTTSQDLGLDVQYRVSPHVNVRVSEALYYTSGIFGPANNYNGTVPGIPQGNNPFVATPLTTQFGNISRGEVGYQMSGSSVMGASGGYATSRFSHIPPAVSPGLTLLNTETEDAAGFYMHRLFPGNWLGVSYLFQHMAFPPSISETYLHSPLAFDTITLGENMSLSFFGGPQYYDNTAPVSIGSTTALGQRGWTGAGGASFGWQGPNTSATVSVVRRLADGGGLLGASEVTSGTAGLRRQITKFWSAELGASYAVNDALSATVTNTSSIRFATGAVNVQRQLSERLSVRFGYARQFQGTDSTGTTSDANRNQFIVTLAYEFTRPWGR